MLIFFPQYGIKKVKYFSKHMHRNVYGRLRKYAKICDYRRSFVKVTIYKNAYTRNNVSLFSYKTRTCMRYDKFHRIKDTVQTSRQKCKAIPILKLQKNNNKQLGFEYKIAFCYFLNSKPDIMQIV